MRDILNCSPLKYKFLEVGFFKLVTVSSVPGMVSGMQLAFTDYN